MEDEKQNEQSQENQPSQEVATSPNNNMLYVGIAVVAVVLVGSGIILFSKNNAKPLVEGTSVSNVKDVSDTTNTQNQFSNGSTESNSENSDSAATNIKTFEVEAGSFYFNPKEIRVNQGDTVKIVLTAKDMMHDFNIDELGVDGDFIKEGETITIEFVADQIGVFEYYCSVGQHRANGQVGTLIVE